MRSKQYFTSIENNPHENSTEPRTLLKKGIMLPKQEIKKSVNGYYSYLRFHYCWTTRNTNITPCKIANYHIILYTNTLNQ